MKLKSILSQNAFWIVNKQIAKIVGIEAALLLSYLIDKEDSLNKVLKDDYEWFYRHSDSIEQETTLTYTVQKSCIKKLENEQFISTCLMGIPRKLYFTIHELCILEKFNYIIEETLTMELRKPELIYNKEPNNKELINKEPNNKIKFEKSNFKKWNLSDFENEIKMHRAAVNLSKDDIISFYDYWREMTPSGKMKFQLEKSWETDLRLKTWERNKSKFSKTTNKTEEIKDKMNDAFNDVFMDLVNKM